jgi:hypothetical protein
MTNLPPQIYATNSISELVTDFLILRDALNELALTLSDLQFRIDIDKRNKAIDQTRLMLDRLKVAQGDRHD